MCEVRVQCKNKEQRLALSPWHALAGRKRTRSGSKLPAANSRSRSIKKGVAIREFEKIVEKNNDFSWDFVENSWNWYKMTPGTRKCEKMGPCGEQKWTEGRLKGSQLEPKGCQKGAKVRQRCVQKSMFGQGREKGAKKRDHVWEKGCFLSHFGT